MSSGPGLTIESHPYPNRICKGRSSKNCGIDTGSPMVYCGIKVISKPKPWEILFITCYNTTFPFTLLLSNLLDSKVPNVISTVLRYKLLWRHRSGI